MHPGAKNHDRKNCARSTPASGEEPPIAGRSARMSGDATFEPHYSIAELARLWKFSRETLRLIVKDEPGVLKVCRGLRKKKTHYSIPESVVKRIHTMLFNGNVDPGSDIIYRQ
jgi:hypothetical protein